MRPQVYNAVEVRKKKKKKRWSSIFFFANVPKRNMNDNLHLFILGCLTFPPPLIRSLFIHWGGGYSSVCSTFKAPFCCLLLKAVPLKVPQGGNGNKQQPSFPSTYRLLHLPFHCLPAASSASPPPCSAHPFPFTSPSSPCALSSRLLWVLMQQSQCAYTRTHMNMGSKYNHILV